MKQNKVTAIILAAGKGSRMKTKTSKVYLELMGRPVIMYSIEAFERSNVDEIILVVSPGYKEYVEDEIVKKGGYTKVTKVISGGTERFESVNNGLLACEEVTEKDYVLIHDGARAFIQPEQINQCIEKVKEYNACVMGMPIKDTIHIVDQDKVCIDTPDRSKVWITQTPQCFLLSEAKEAYEQLIARGDRNVTDDVMVIEKYVGRRSVMVECSYDNIKITTPEDMVIGESILKRHLGDTI